MTKKTDKKRRIPAKFVTLGLALFALILTIIIYVSVTLSSVDSKKLIAYNLAGVTNVLDHDDHDGHDHELTEEQKKSIEAYKKVDMIEANSFAEDGYVSSTNKGLKYSYANVGNLKVDLVATTYSKPQVKDDAVTKNGKLSFYVGFNAITSSDSVKVDTVKVFVAEEWSGFAKSVSVSSGYNSDYVGYETMKFYSSERSATLDKNIDKKYLLGFKHVENPSIFVYVEFTDKGKTQKGIVRFDYKDYYINGQSQPE